MTSSAADVAGPDVIETFEGSRNSYHVGQGGIPGREEGGGGGGGGL